MGREVPPPEIQTRNNDNIRFEEFFGRFRKNQKKKIISQSEIR